MSDDPELPLATTLRDQVGARITAQHQLVVIAAAIAGLTASLGAKGLNVHSELVSLLALLFVGLALAMLRHEQEITIILSHLVDESAFHEHARAQSQWESYRLRIMQGAGMFAWLTSGSQAIGIYGVPVLGAVASAWAALSDSPTFVTWAVLAAALVLSVLFAFGVVDVLSRYRDIRRKEPEAPG